MCLSTAKSGYPKLIDDAVTECIRNDYSFGMYAAVIAEKLEEQLESDLATAEQDSRQKQARIDRLEAAVKELRGALTTIRDAFAGTAGITHDEMMACITANTALKNTEGA